MTRLLLAAGLVAGMAAAPAMAQTNPPLVQECPGGTVPLTMSGVLYCMPSAAIPNRALTPGAVASTSRAEVCGRNAAGLTYSESHRHTTEAMKRRVAAMYGIPWSQHHLYIFDHLVPLGLGGADSIANIWPEPVEPAIEKDEGQEIPMIRDVCDGWISLDAAQRYFLSGEWEGK